MGEGREAPRRERGPLAIGSPAPWQAAMLGHIFSSWDRVASASLGRGDAGRERNNLSARHRTAVSSSLCLLMWSGALGLGSSADCFRRGAEAALLGLSPPRVLIRRLGDGGPSPRSRGIPTTSGLALVHVSRLPSHGRLIGMFSGTVDSSTASRVSPHVAWGPGAHVSLRP